jgi:hypothetical protein
MQISSISNPPLPAPTERSSELISSFALEVTEKIFLQLTDVADRWSGACVCKDWKLVSSDADKMLRILRWPFGTDLKPGLPQMMAPKSSMPKLMEKNIVQFANQPCPLNPEKALHETSILVYLGSTILDHNRHMTYKPHPANYGLITFDKALLNTTAITSLSSKPKWMVIPKQPFGLINVNGDKTELTTEEIEKIKNAESQGYRKLTGLELGHGVFFGYQGELNNFEKPMDNQNAEYKKPWILDPNHEIKNDITEINKVVICEDIEEDGTVVESYIKFQLQYGTPTPNAISKQEYEANSQKYITGIMLGKEFEA